MTGPAPLPTLRFLARALPPGGRLAIGAAFLVLSTGCVKQLAVNSLGDALSSGGDTFASDDDPELVEAAIPFSLKLMESLLAESPEHDGLLRGAAAGFTQYAYAFVAEKAAKVDEQDPARARELRERAKRLYDRARRYGLRGLEVRHEGFGAQLAQDRKAALAELEEEDVPLLYWTAAAWVSRIALSKDDMTVVGELAQPEALMARALELDPDWGDGAIHEFYVAYDGGRSEATGGSVKRAREHMDQALALTGGQKIGVYVTWAETVSVQAQDKKEFDAMLDKALAFDADDAPKYRLVNLISQDRARRLKAAAGDLFLEE